MKTLAIKDLALDTRLDRKAMSAIRGGAGDKQANGTSQGNLMAAFSPMSVANGAIFANSAPVIIQADNDVDQHASNDSTSSNYKGNYGWFFA